LAPSAVPLFLRLLRDPTPKSQLLDVEAAQGPLLAGRRCRVWALERLWSA